MNSIPEDILMHYGMPRRSGRYPWGSGDDPYQHSGDFLSRVQELKKTGMSETDIAKNIGLTTTQLRTQISLAKDERRSLQVATAKGLREKGYSLNEIADKMGFSNDSSVRSLLNENSERRMNQAKATADIIRKEITRAIRHSMVVIDAEKHALDYKQSEIDNGIASLKKKYQGSIDKDGNYHEGASTLISRAKSETQVYKRKGSPIINEDGSLSYKTVKEEYVDKNGKLKFRMQNSTKMAEAKDARELSSGTPQEEAYADYANTMKSLANQARREMINTGKIAYSAAAKNTYQGEVKSLSAKLNIALSNAPRERQAQAMANATVAAKKKENPDMTKAEIKKANQQALSSARTSVGAHRTPVEITDREWEAIQAGAISENKLIQILNNTNIDTIRQRATPRATNSLSTAKQHRISAMRASGYTTSEIADALGVSTSTVSKYLNGKG